MLGFSINTLTLLGVVLSIGLVVDDAIVVLENIHRHIEDGMKPYQAALLGSKEIGFAVIAMTITLAAVFTPLSFAQGNTGKLMTEFALTVATSVIVSGFVALSLVPMMCSRLLKHEPQLGVSSRPSRSSREWSADIAPFSVPRCATSLGDRRCVCGNARCNVLVVHATQR